MTCIPCFVFWTWISRSWVPKKLLHTVRAAEDMGWAERRTWGGGEGIIEKGQTGWWKVRVERLTKIVSMMQGLLTFKSFKVKQNTYYIVSLAPHSVPGDLGRTQKFKRSVRFISSLWGTEANIVKKLEGKWSRGDENKHGGNTLPQRHWWEPSSCPSWGEPSSSETVVGGPLPVLPGGTLFLSLLGGNLFLSFLVGTLFLFFLSLGVTPSWQNLKAWRTW